MDEFYIRLVIIFMQYISFRYLAVYIELLVITLIHNDFSLKDGPRIESPWGEI